MGVPPIRIDIMTSIAGVEFDECWPRRITARFQHLEIPVIGLDDLITNKRAVGRPQDLVDVDLLTRMKAKRG